MVWFQCEDCGENLKKPKLPNHFRICSAYKLSCIDCGKTFDQQTVQSHTQCISEAEKYGPKGQVRASSNGQAKPEKPKANADVDVNVGLSSRAPWKCSLCNTSTTSQQTLLLHADGKKHRAKARAFHASQKQAVEPTASDKDTGGDKSLDKSAETNGLDKTCDSKEEETVKASVETFNTEEFENQNQVKRKRQDSAFEEKLTKGACNISNGEVIQSEQREETIGTLKRKKLEDAQESKDDLFHKIKWKKLVTTTLKAYPDGKMKVKKLQKVVIKTLIDSGVTEEEVHLRQALMDKITSSSRFIVQNKKIQLASEVEI